MINDTADFAYISPSPLMGNPEVQDQVGNLKACFQELYRENPGVAIAALDQLYDSTGAIELSEPVPAPVPEKPTSMTEPSGHHLQAALLGVAAGVAVWWLMSRP